MAQSEDQDPLPDQQSLESVKNHLETLFNQFDYSGRGFLTKYEYQALCFSQMVRPRNYDGEINMKQVEETFYNDTGEESDDENDPMLKYFYFLSGNSSFITVESLTKAIEKLSIHPDVERMVFSISDTGQIDYQAFKKIFKNKP